MENRIEEIKYCKRGHPRTPENVDGSGHCKMCNAERQREWQLANPEKAKEIAKKKRATGKYKEKRKKWPSRNSEKAKERKRKWRLLNRGRASNELQNWYIANKLGLKIKETPTELIELKRNAILFKRALREFKQALKG